MATLALTAAPAFAQILFNMDYSAGAYPNAGWTSSRSENERWRRARIAGGGPSGQDAMELTQLYAGSSSSWGGQFYWGWMGDVESQDPPQGARRYYRWRMRFSPNTNLRALNWNDGSRTGIENKLLIVGDTCGSSCRFILTYEGDITNNRVGAFRLQLDGGAFRVGTPPQAFGQWLNIQIELDSSTTTGSGDGGYKIWINNNNYGSPTAQISGFQLNPRNWRYVGFGYYNNHGLASDGVHIWRHSDFQVATTFDSNWGSGGSGSTTVPPPQQPTNVRVLQ
jgi:hypothetical protein